MDKDFCSIFPMCWSENFFRLPENVKILHSSSEALLVSASRIGLRTPNLSLLPAPLIFLLTQLSEETSGHLEKLVLFKFDIKMPYSRNLFPKCSQPSRVTPATMAFYPFILFATDARCREIPCFKPK